MARYHFDFWNGHRLVRDRVGGEHDGPESIRQEAMAVLPDFARDAIPADGDRQVFGIVVRNADGQAVYTATLSFAAVWLGDEALPAAGEPADHDA